VKLSKELSRRATGKTLYILTHHALYATRPQ